MKKLNFQYNGAHAYMADTREALYVKYILPDSDISEYLECELVPKSTSYKVLVKKPCILLLQNLLGNGLTADHLRLVRDYRGDDVDMDTRLWPRLRVALRYNSVPRVHQPGGFCPPVYKDEMAVTDFIQNGSSGWIVKKSDLGSLLESLPPKEAPGEPNLVMYASSIPELQYGQVYKFTKETVGDTKYEIHVGERTKVVKRIMKTTTGKDVDHVYIIDKVSAHVDRLLPVKLHKFLS